MKIVRLLHCLSERCCSTPEDRRCPDWSVAGLGMGRKKQGESRLAPNIFTRHTRLIVCVVNEFFHPSHKLPARRREILERRVGSSGGSVSEAPFAAICVVDASMCEVRRRKISVKCGLCQDCMVVSANKLLRAITDGYWTGTCIVGAATESPVKDSSSSQLL